MKLLPRLRLSKLNFSSYLFLLFFFSRVVSNGSTGTGKCEKTPATLRSGYNDRQRPGSLETIKLEEKEKKNGGEEEEEEEESKIIPFLFS